MDFNRHNWLTDLFGVVCVLLRILLTLGILLGTPLVFIWAFNALFPALAIPYIWETYLAAFIFYYVVMIEPLMRTLVIVKQLKHST
jgi:hypothetical protein